MAPWDEIEDAELRDYLDAAMFFMVELGGLEMHEAWRRLDGLWPKDMSPGRERGLFFHKPPDDLALDLALGRGWWMQPEFEGPPTPRYARLRAALADGSWERMKREAFP